jgi:hypothetical protein
VGFDAIAVVGCGVECDAVAFVFVAFVGFAVGVSAAAANRPLVFGSDCACLAFREDEDAIAVVRGADGGSWYAVPDCVVPARGQVCEYVSESEAKVPCDVFQECVLGSYVANDAVHLGPEVAVVVGAVAVAGVAEGLAGVAAGEELEGSEFGAVELVDVVDAWGGWPVSLEDLVGVWGIFDLSDAGVSGVFEAEVESADAGEDANELHGW